MKYSIYQLLKIFASLFKFKFFNLQRIKSLQTNVNVNVKVLIFCIFNKFTFIQHLKIDIAIIQVIIWMLTISCKNSHSSLSSINIGRFYSIKIDFICVID